MTEGRKRDRQGQPTRRDLLVGGFALAGAGLAGMPAGSAARPERAAGRLVLTLEMAGPIGAAAVLAEAAPRLAREGLGIGAVDLLVAEGSRPAGFGGRLLAPAALVALTPERLARLLALPGPAQIAAPWTSAPGSPALALDRLAALLLLSPDLSCCIVALRAAKPLEEADRRRFDVALAPVMRTIRA